MLHVISGACTFVAHAERTEGFCIPPFTSQYRDCFIRALVSDVTGWVTTIGNRNCHYLPLFKVIQEVQAWLRLKCLVRDEIGYVTDNESKRRSNGSSTESPQHRRLSNSRNCSQAFINQMIGCAAPRIAWRGMWIPFAQHFDIMLCI